MVLCPEIAYPLCNVERCSLFVTGVSLATGSLGQQVKAPLPLYRKDVGGAEMPGFARQAGRGGGGRKRVASL